MAGWTSKLILAFVTLLIGIVLIGSVASEGNSRTELKSIVNDSIDIGSAMEGVNMVNESVVFTVGTLGDTNANCPMTSISASNGSGTQVLTTANYNFTESAGQFTLVNTTALYSYLNQTNTTEWNYTYCPTGYMNLAWGRTAVDIVPGFFAIALLLTSIALFFSVYQDIKGGI